MSEEISSLKEKPWIVYPTFFYSNLKSGPLSIGRAVANLECPSGMVDFQVSEDEELHGCLDSKEVIGFETPLQAIDYIVKNTPHSKPYSLREDLEIQLLRDFPSYAQSRPKYTDPLEGRCCGD